MPDRSPAGPLMHEHRIIERIVPVLAHQLASIESEGRVDPEALSRATDFLRTYADRCHHGKEEDILFRRLVHKPLEEDLARTMDHLIDEHALARAYTRRLIHSNRRYNSGELHALDVVGSALRGLVGLYPRHIQLEDRHFFRQAMEYFGRDERNDIMREFEEFDRALMHDYYRAVVEDLERASSEPVSPPIEERVLVGLGA